MAGPGMQLLVNLGQGAVGEVLRYDPQEHAAHEGEVGQQIGVAGTGAVLAHHRIPPPMVADFHPAPVAADPPQPVLGALVLGRQAAEVVAGFGGGVAGFFEGALAAQHDQAAGKGEVDLQGFDGKRVELADFDPAVAAGRLGKKGVPGRASWARACLRSLGWLPLIWKR